MLQQILFIIAVAAGGGAETGGGGGSDTVVQDAPAKVETAKIETADTGGLVAEDQTPSGRFLTATEVKPILGMTRNNWVAVREYNGQDLLYVTHLMAWRCGLARLEYAVNDADYREWPLPPCYVDEATPNAIKTEDGLPYQAFALKSVEQVRIRLTYDDLTIEEGTFGRLGIEIK